MDVAPASNAFSNSSLTVSQELVSRLPDEDMGPCELTCSLQVDDDLSRREAMD